MSLEALEQPECTLLLTDSEWSLHGRRPSRAPEPIGVEAFSNTLSPACVPFADGQSIRIWLWVYVPIAIVGIWLVPSVIGFALAVLSFVYLMRGVEWLERRRSEALFCMEISVPPRKMSDHTGFQGWLHPDLSGHQQFPVLDGLRTPSSSDDLRPRGHRSRARSAGVRATSTGRRDRRESQR